MSKFLFFVICFFVTSPLLEGSLSKFQFSPFLLPEDHPIKPALDEIFNTSRVTQDIDSFLTAGFHIISNRPRTFIHVASHPNLPGYLVKVQFDNELRKKKNKSSDYWFHKRCEGAKLIRHAIKKGKCKHFVVADKWIYPLPLTAHASQKPVILVVKDMEIVSLQESMKAWKTEFTKQHLNELYSILHQSGGASYRPDNIAYTKSGKFAFIDTEYPFAQPNYHQIELYLSEEMKKHWQKLMEVLALDFQ